MIWLTVNVSLGFGRHLNDLFAEDPTRTLKLAKLSYCFAALNLWAYVLPKLPVVALLVRLFSTHTKRFGYILWSLLGFLIMWTIALTIVTFVKCDPLQKNWNPMLPGTCWDTRIWLYMGYFHAGKCLYISSLIELSLLRCRILRNA